MTAALLLLHQKFALIDALSGAFAGFNVVDQAYKQLPRRISFRLQSCNGGVEFTKELFSRHLFYGLSHLFLPWGLAACFLISDVKFRQRLSETPQIGHDVVVRACGPFGIPLPFGITLDSARNSQSRVTAAEPQTALPSPTTDPTSRRKII